MPECVINEVPVRLCEKEMECYQTLKDDLILSLDGQDIDAINAVGLSNKLTQMANGAVYGEDGKVIAVHDRKLDALEDLIEAANGKPVLVAYWFKHDLERIQKRFKVEKLDSADSIKRWNNGDIPVAVVHPASAGHEVAEAFRHHVVKEVSRDLRAFAIFDAVGNGNVFFVDDLAEEFFLLVTGIREFGEPIKRNGHDEFIKDFFLAIYGDVDLAVLTNDLGHFAVELGLVEKMVVNPFPNGLGAIRPGPKAHIDEFDGGGHVKVLHVRHEFF